MAESRPADPAVSKSNVRQVPREAWVRPAPTPPQEQTKQTRSVGQDKSREDIRSAAAALGPAELDEILRFFDQDQNGSIDPAELENAFRRMKRDALATARFKSSCAIYDKICAILAKKNMAFEVWVRSTKRTRSSMTEGLTVPFPIKMIHDACALIYA